VPVNLLDVNQKLLELTGIVLGSSTTGGTPPPVVGGPFLPLTGGTLTGPLVVGGGTLQFPYAGSTDLQVATSGSETARFVGDHSFVVGNLGVNEQGDLMGAGRFVGMTTNSTTAVVAAGGASTFTPDDVGRLVYDPHSTATFPYGTRIATVIDSLNATLTTAALTSGSITPIVGAFGSPLFAFDGHDPDFTVLKSRTTGLMIGHHSYTAAGSGHTDLMFPSVALQITVAHQFEDDPNSTMDTAGAGPRGLVNVEGNVWLGAGVDQNDATGGPLINSGLIYQNTYDAVSAPGGIIYGVSLSPQFLATGTSTGVLNLSSVGGYWSNAGIRSQTGTTIDIGEFKAYQTGEFIGGASTGTNNVHRYVGFHAAPPTVLSATVDRIVCVDIGGEVYRALTGLSNSAGSANVTSATNQFFPSDVGGIFHIAGGGGVGTYVLTYNSPTSVTLSAPIAAANTAVAGEVLTLTRNTGYTSGTVNIGLANAMPTVWTPLTQIVAATGTTLTPTATAIHAFVAADAVLANPNFTTANMIDGQVCEVFNSGPGTITYTDGQGVALPSTTIVQPAGTITKWRFFALGPSWSNRWVLDSPLGSGTAFFLDGTANSVTGFGIVTLRSVAPATTLLFQHAPTTNSGQIQVGDTLGELLFAGSYNTTPSFNNGAAITANAAETFSSSTNGGTSLNFYTTTVGSAALSLAATIGNDLSLTVNGYVQVNSDITASGSVFVTGDVIGSSNINAAGALNSLAGVFTTGGAFGLDFVGTEFGATMGAQPVPCTIDLRATRGTDLAHLSHTVSGDVIGGMHIGGSFDSQLVDSAQIYCRATETYGDGTSTFHSGTQWEFWVTPNGVTVNPNVTPQKVLAVTIGQDSSVLVAGVLQSNGLLYAQAGGNVDNGDFSVGNLLSPAFVVDHATGDTSTTGTLTSGGDFTVGSPATFTVTASTGAVQVGTTSVTGGLVNVAGAVTVENPFLGLSFISTQWSGGTSAVQNALDMRGSRGTGLGSYSALQSGDKPGSIHIGIDNGVGLIDVAMIQYVMTENASGTTNVGGKWEVYTQPNATAWTSTGVLAATFGQDGSFTSVGPVISAGLTVTPPIVGGFASSVFYGIAGIPLLSLRRINGTVAAPTKVVNSNVISQIFSAGQYDTTVGHVKNGASITALATADWTATNVGGAKLVFQTLPDASATLTTALTLGQDQSATFAGSLGMFGVTPVAQTATAAAAPAGGTGTAAGGWDTAAHRDTAITLMNQMRTALRAIGAMA
jgi:hypothetical protein